MKINKTRKDSEVLLMNYSENWSLGNSRGEVNDMDALDA